MIIEIVDYHEKTGRGTGMRGQGEPAQAVSPGEIIAMELEERGWSQRDLAEIMGRPPQAISEIIRGTKQITPETAMELVQVFGTSAEIWMNLEANYRLQITR